MPKEHRPSTKSAKSSMRMENLSAAIDSLAEDDEMDYAILQGIMTLLSVRDRSTLRLVTSFTKEEKQAVVEAFKEGPLMGKQKAALAKISEIAAAKKEGGARRRTRRRSNRSKVRSRK
jgi:hypothetical protein